MQTSELLTVIAVLLCSSPIYFLTLVQLRFVKAMHNKLVTETLNLQEEIKYEQINYVFQSALTKPVFIRISYTDEQTGRTRKFYAMGSLTEEAFTVNPLQLKEVELTKFIRRRIIEVNPKYDEGAEPSRWLIPLLTFAIILGTFLIGSLILNKIGV